VCPICLSMVGWIAVGGGAGGSAAALIFGLRRIDKKREMPARSQAGPTDTEEE